MFNKNYFCLKWLSVLIISRKKSPNMLVMKSGEKPNLENYSVFFETLSSTFLKCCELLSNCIFTGFFDNTGMQRQPNVIVVNCFQIVFLLGSLTTGAVFHPVYFMLWIAFKLYFYWVLWQLWLENKQLLFVVNCFQIVFLLGSLTTSRIEW